MKSVNYLFATLVGVTCAASYAYAADCSELDGTYYCYANEAAANEGDKCKIKDVFELQVNSDSAALRNTLSKTEVFSLPLNGEVSERRNDETVINEAAVCKSGALIYGAKSSLYESVTKERISYELNSDGNLILKAEATQENSALGQAPKFNSTTNVCVKVSRARAALDFNPLTGFFTLISKKCGKFGG